MKKMTSSDKTRGEIIILSSLFLIFAFWRVALYFFPGTEGEFNMWSFAWGASYQFVALWGAFRGFVIAQSWGGWKSLMGRSLLSFSIGLLLQSFGQTVSSFFVYHTGEIPYPSLGDVGFFGSILFYIYGVCLLARVSGVSVSLRDFAKQAIAVIVFALMLIGSYLIFLKGLTLDWSDPTMTFLNFGYPLFQAGYVAIAVLTLLLSHGYLGGMMKGPIFIFLIALFAQYASDFTFLYQITYELYVPEGINDLMYFTSYFVMAIALIYIGGAFNKIRESK